MSVNQSNRRSSVFHPECLSYDDMKNLRWHTYAWPDGSKGELCKKSVSHLEYPNWFERTDLTFAQPYNKFSETKDNLSWHNFSTAENISTYVRDICGGKFSKMDTRPLLDRSEVKFVGCTTYLLNYQPIHNDFLKENLRKRQTSNTKFKQIIKPKFQTATCSSTYESEFKNFFKSTCNI